MRGLPKKWEWVVRILLVAAVVFGLNYLPGEVRDAPYPPSICEIGLPCAVIAVLFLRPLWVGIASSIAFFAVGFFCYPLYRSAADREGVGWRGVPMVAWQTNEMQFNEIASSVPDDFAGQSHKACFVDDLGPAGKRDVSDLSFRPLREYSVIRCWHTSFTDLVHFESPPARIWFKGGSLDQGTGAYKLVGEGAVKSGYWPPDPPPRKEELTDSDVASISKVMNTALPPAKNR